MKKNIIIALVVYLAVGVVFALHAWTNPLKAFTCDAPNEPHGTIGMGGMWQNPDPSRCTRDGFGMHHIMPLPYLAVAWPFVISAKLINEHHHDTRVQQEQTLPEDEEAEIPLGGSVNDMRHTSASLGLSIAYPEHVYFLEDSAYGLVFSLLESDDTRQQSSVGLATSLAIGRTETVPENGTPVVISLYGNNPYGIRALVSEEIGAYAGELHRTYYFLDYGIRAHYVVSPDTEAAFEPMIRSIQFASLAPVTLIDGEDTVAGIFRASSVENGLKSFTSEKLALSFRYPAAYLLFDVSREESTTHSISIIPEEYALQFIADTRARAVGRSGPPSMRLTFFRVPED